VLGQEVDAYARELVYRSVLCRQTIKEGRGLLKEIEDNRCAMQHHAYLHMRAVGLVVYQATISVHWPMHMLCMKAVACISHHHHRYPLSSQRRSSESKRQVFHSAMRLWNLRSVRKERLAAGRGGRAVCRHKFVYHLPSELSSVPSLIPMNWHDKP
jgi:hypothetical protein